LVPVPVAAKAAFKTVQAIFQSSADRLLALNSVIYAMLAGFICVNQRALSLHGEGLRKMACHT
jgi:hypothetical protein